MVNKVAWGVVEKINDIHGMSSPLHGSCSTWPVTALLHREVVSLESTGRCVFVEKLQSCNNILTSLYTTHIVKFMVVGFCRRWGGRRNDTIPLRLEFWKYSVLCLRPSALFREGFSCCTLMPRASKSTNERMHSKNT